MQDTSSNNKRIAKNTLFLYFRTLFVMVISLFTSRVVLNTLGIIDFGIYNVVGGVVTMFAFFNAAMTSGTQRFLTYSLTRDCFYKQNVTFNTTLLVHLLLGICIVILIETIGLWFLNNKMVIPEHRLNAAQYVFQFCTLSLFFSIVSVPYNASLIVHENMKVFAYMSIIEAVSKLLIVYILKISLIDKLIIYGFLLLLVSLLLCAMYNYYVTKKYQETRFKWCFDINLLKKMGAFATWNMISNLALMGVTQGLNMVLNVFFGPVVNAARGIAVQVQGSLMQFVQNFQMAINPQITKTYANGQLENMHMLVCRSAKFSFFLLFIFSIPFFICADLILELWLKKVPEYSSIFLNLIIIAALIDTLSNPLNNAMNAVGKIRNFQLINGLLMLLVVPVSFLVLYYYKKPYLVFIIQIIFTFITHFIKLTFVHKETELSMILFWRIVYSNIICVLCLSVIPIFLLQMLIPFSICFIIFLSFGGILYSMAIIYFIGLDQNERNVVNQKLSSVSNKINIWSQKLD